MLFNNGLLKINNQSLIKEELYDLNCNQIQISYPIYIVVKYTKKCNLSCAYCYVSSDDNRFSSMSNSLIVNIMKKLKDQYGDKEFILCLHGGEPVLRYNDMSNLLQELKKVSDKIKISLQSNATLITKEIAEFFRNENIRVGISIDGYNNKTNSQRCYCDGKSSLLSSQQGLQNLLNVGIVPGILCVIHSFNQDNILNFFDYYVEKGIKKFGFKYFFPAGNGKNVKYKIDINTLVETNIKLIQKINDYNSRVKESNSYIAERETSTLINNIVNKKRGNMCSTSPCGAGKLTLAFDTNGDVYPCDSFITQSNFCYGNIQNLNIKTSVQKNNISKKLNEHNVNNITECSICNWKKICTLQCASDSYFFNNELNQPHSLCGYMKKIIPTIIDLLHNNKIDPKNFILC